MGAEQSTGAEGLTSHSEQSIGDCGANQEFGDDIFTIPSPESSSADLVSPIGPLDGQHLDGAVMGDQLEPTSPSSGSSTNDYSGSAEGTELSLIESQPRDIDTKYSQRTEIGDSPRPLTVDVIHESRNSEASNLTESCGTIHDEPADCEDIVATEAQEDGVSPVKLVEGSSNGMPNIDCRMPDRQEASIEQKEILLAPAMLPAILNAEYDVKDLEKVQVREQRRQNSETSERPRAVNARTECGSGCPTIAGASEGNETEGKEKEESRHEETGEAEVSQSVAENLQRCGEVAAMSLPCIGIQESSLTEEDKEVNSYLCLACGVERWSGCWLYRPSTSSELPHMNADEIEKLTKDVLADISRLIEESPHGVKLTLEELDHSKEASEIAEFLDQVCQERTHKGSSCERLWNIWQSVEMVDQDISRLFEEVQQVFAEADVDLDDLLSSVFKQRSEDIASKGSEISKRIIDPLSQLGKHNIVAPKKCIAAGTSSLQPSSKLLKNPQLSRPSLGSLKAKAETQSGLSTTRLKLRGAPSSSPALPTPPGSFVKAKAGAGSSSGLRPPSALKQ